MFLPAPCMPCKNATSIAPNPNKKISDSCARVGKSASRQVGKSASRQVGKSACRRHPARERSSARVGRGSSGRRCVPRAATGDQHTPQTADRKFGADSKGVGDISSGSVYLVILLFSLVNLFCQFLVLDYPHNSMGNTRLLTFSQPFWGIYPLF